MGCGESALGWTFSGEFLFEMRMDMASQLMEIGGRYGNDYEGLSYSQKMAVYERCMDMK